MLRWLVFMAVGGPATILFSLVSLVGGLVRAPSSLHDRVHRTWSRFLLWLAGVDVVAEGLEHLRRDEAQVVVSNHQSLFDIFVLFATLPVSLRFVAKSELSRVPVFADAMRHAGHVFVDRERGFRALTSLEDAGRRMKRKGLTLCLFPEGTRSAEGRLGRFKPGAFVLAIDSRTPMVPVAVEGGGEILPRGRRRLEPRTVHVRCAEPVPLEGMSRADRHELAEHARVIIGSMLEAIREERRVRRHEPDGR